jgi:hypothetical protein
VAVEDVFPDDLTARDHRDLYLGVHEEQTEEFSADVS